MKPLSFALAAFSLMALSGCSSADKEKNETPAIDSATTQTTAVDTLQEEAPPMDSAAVAKAWEVFATPGKMHQWMASTDGKWTGEMVMWPAPGAPATPPSKVTAENKTVLGGRYQESVFKGGMMGMDFEGHGILAYDNIKKKFVNTWIDNMGTGVMVMEGDYDEAAKTINLKGKMTDPATGTDSEMRQILKIIDDKNQIMEMYNIMKDGQEFKTMEIKLTKK